MENDINVDEYNMVQLRGWLRNLNLPTSGNKDALILRINEVPIADRGVCPDGPVGNGQNEEGESGEDVSDEDESDAATIGTLKRELALLKRELALSKKEKAIAAVENDLLNRQIEHGSSSASTARDYKNLDFATIRDLLPDFDGDSSVELWPTHFRSLSENFNLNEETKKALLIYKLKGNVKTWFYSKPDCLSSTVDMVLNEMCDF